MEVLDMKLGLLLSSTLVASSIVLAGANSPASAQQQRPPNILVIMGDDVGWFNIGAYHQNPRPCFMPPGGAADIVDDGGADLYRVLAQKMPAAMLRPTSARSLWPSLSYTAGAHAHHRRLLRLLLPQIHPFHCLNDNRHLIDACRA